ncbi:hypothetical protein COY07_05045 [Candidatus Peregrinibacteria bacterium CG_4_10_14_0_2_um_filter_43_11]|nr:MAG: hypothetical protein COY07_05045 [Candidatus Peregrinibacteria bacterium CG_4_10_14_0_2_um_filter_43_11]
MFIVTPIQERSQKKALQRIKTLYGKVDGAEIWLDHIEDLDLETLFNDIKKIPSFFSPRLTRRGLKKRLQILICCKKPIEKGHFKGTYSQLASLLIRAGQLGADYIDIPFNMPKNLIKKIVQQSRAEAGYPPSPHPETCRGIYPLVIPHTDAESHPKLIFSYHNFKKTPSLKTLLKKAESMRLMGADIVKIAVQAQSTDDALKLIFLADHLKTKNIPHCLIAMGKKGILSRIITPHLGGTFMFAPLTKNKSTAPGQLTVAELKKAWSLIKHPD